jgi:hypothetical protein
MNLGFFIALSFIFIDGVTYSAEYFVSFFTIFQAVFTLLSNVCLL